MLQRHQKVCRNTGAVWRIPPAKPSNNEAATEARLRTFSMQASVRSLPDTESYFRSEVGKWGKMVEAIGIVAK